MKIKHTIEALHSHYRTVRVRFKNSNGELSEKEYTYKVDNEFGVLECGDSVIVDSPYGGLKVVEISGTDEFPNINLDSSISYKWIVDRVNTEAHRERLRKEEEATAIIQELQRRTERNKVLEELKEIGGEAPLYKRLLSLFGLAGKD